MSIWHILLVLVIVLLFFGPQRLPGLGKSIGEAIRGFKKGLENNEIDVTDSSEKLNQGGQAPSAKSTEKDKDKA